MLILLSGPIGSGKTTLCQGTAAEVRKDGMPVAGVLTPALIRGGVKVGIQAVDLGSGEVRLLARTDRDLGGTRIGRYTFDDRTLDWMRSVCEVALAGGALAFVDEIGRLELDRGSGLASLIPLLSLPRDGSTVVVVRDTLLDVLAARTMQAGPRVVRLDASRREDARKEMRALLLPGSGSCCTQAR